MKVPPFYVSGLFGVHNSSLNTKLPMPQESLSPLKNDTVSFSSTAKYLKKYVTLPDEIKAVLSPKDAVDMFKDMELVANGKIKRKKVGSGYSSRVHEIPWLKDYYLIVLRDADMQNQVVYSDINLGDAVWSDNDNACIQIIKKSA